MRYPSTLLFQPPLPIAGSMPEGFPLRSSLSSLPSEVLEVYLHQLKIQETWRVWKSVGHKVPLRTKILIYLSKALVHSFLGRNKHF